MIAVTIYGIGQALCAVILVGTSVVIAAAGAVLWRESMTPSEAHSLDRFTEGGQTVTARCRCGQEFTAYTAESAQAAWGKHYWQETR